MIHIGSTIGEKGRYEILKEIGRGGMSIVYLAMDNKLNKSIVVKDIRRRDNGNDSILINSLHTELNLLKNLDHTALPKIYDIIQNEEDIYVVMDYIEGESLKQKLKREGPLPSHLVIDYAKQLSDVLTYLHNRKPNPIIYRDMKPDNVMLTPEGKIKLIDFGISREYKDESTTDTTNLGTRAYAAPEQIAGKQTDARTDIYSFGVTLYNLVTGKSLLEPPFELKPIRYWNQMLPEGLEYIINKCTQAEPEDRYQRCEDLVHDLANVDKLTKGYRKKLYKKVSKFAISVAFLIFFFSVTLIGAKGMYNEKLSDYKALISLSDRYLIDGNQTESIKVLDDAIREVDSSRSEAYINLINIYINRRETEVGLAKVEGYINDKYGNVNENDEVLFKVAMTYLDIKNYPLALKYFQKVNVKKIPDAQYYKTLTTSLSSINVDYEKFQKQLLEFEKYNDTLAKGERMLANYNSLANIYTSYKGRIENANDKIIEIMDKSNEILIDLGDDGLKLLYEVEFNSKLAQAYHSRGVTSKENEIIASDLNKAITYYEILLDIDGAQKESTLIKIGEIYTDMGNYNKAIEQFNSVLKDYPSSNKAHIKLINLLLDIEQGKSEDVRNFTAAREAYVKATNVEGILQDDEFKKLQRRMSNLSIL